MEGWTEPDGTVYRRKENGDYEIISPKKATKAKKPKKTTKKE